MTRVRNDTPARHRGQYREPYAVPFVPTGDRHNRPRRRSDDMSIVRSMILGTALWVGAAGVFPAGAVAEAQRGQCKQEISQLCAGAERGPARRECVTKNFDQF